MRLPLRIFSGLSSDVAVMGSMELSLLEGTIKVTCRRGRLAPEPGMPRRAAARAFDIAFDHD